GVAGPVALVANSLAFLNPAGPVQVHALPTTIGLRAPTIALFPALRDLTRATGTLADEENRTYLPAATVAAAFTVARAAGGPVTAFIDMAFREARPAVWRRLDTRQGTTALTAARLPDGLLDDPHEHARLTADHARGHRRRLRECAKSVAAARCESGTDTPTVLGRGVTDLVAQAAR
ncbi:hypothetical protein, partial [Frankia sp. KB5]